MWIIELLSVKVVLMLLAIFVLYLLLKIDLLVETKIQVSRANALEKESK